MTELEELITILKDIFPLLTFIGGVALAWFIGFKTLINAVKCLTRDRLVQAYNYHIKYKNDIEQIEYNSFVDLSEAYNTLKGKNGYIERIVSEYKDAPLSWSRKDK